MDHPLANPQRPICGPRSRRRLLVAAAASCAVFVTAACDAGTDPVEGLVAAETDVAALALGLPLPTPDHRAFDPTDGPAASALAEWRRSWDLPQEEGVAARDLLYPVLAGALVGGLDRQDILEEADALNDGVQAARRLVGDDAPPAVTRGIARASGARAAAVDALRREDRRTAIGYLLRGGDALRAVGPEAVARTVVEEAEEAFRRIADDPTYSDQERTRISRLVRGSRQALDEGEWALAIRRAYYAKGLVTQDR